MTDSRIETEAESVVQSAPSSRTIETGHLIFLASQAISLKRIADALEQLVAMQRPFFQVDTSSLFNPDGSPRTIIDTMRPK